MDKDYTVPVFIIGVIAFIAFCGFMDYNYPPIDQKGDREITHKYQDRVQ